MYYGSFPPTESDLDSDSKPYRYIVLCTTFSIDSDSDPCTDSFLNGYCTHFRDRPPSQGSGSVSVGGNEPLANLQIMQLLTVRGAGCNQTF